MTMWTPDLRQRSGPRYIAIAEALAEDAGGGRLRPGTRLPTHRDLADRLGVTVGTITRAYAEATRRGLVTGEVGRGTFVRAPARPLPEIGSPHCHGDNSVTARPSMDELSRSVVSACPCARSRSRA